MTTLLVGLLLFLGNHSVALMALRARRLGKTPGRNVLEGAVFAGVAGWLCVHRLGLWPGARAAGVALKPAQRFSAPGRAADVAGFFVAVCGLPAWACPAGSEAPDVAGGQILGAGAFAGPAGHWRHALAVVALFGGFFVWAVVERISAKRRAAAGLLRRLPLGPPRALNNATALVGGLVVCAVFAFWLHAVLFSVRPFA